jgi:uncharacterized protein YdeI (BOF family)
VQRGAIAPLCTATKASADDMDVKMSGQVVSIEGDKVVLNDGNGYFLVDTDRQRFQNTNLTVGEQITVEGEFDSGKLEAYTISRNGKVIYRNESEAPN